MPRKVATGVKSGRSKVYETKITCPTCGGEISSLDTNCPNCGATRPVFYKPSEVQKTDHVLEGEDLAKVKGGAHPCMYCGTLTWNYEESKNDYVCDKCGAGTGQKTDYELAGGEPDPVPYYPDTTTSEVSTPTQKPAFPLWAKLTIGGFVLILVIWLISSLVTTHPVNGYVYSVEWSRTANQTENQLLQGEGFGLPTNATPEGTPESRHYSDQPNVVGYTHGTYYVTSTPKVVGYEHGTYYVESTPEVIDTTYDTMIETPGAFYNGPDYDCGDPTQEAGGSVSYEQCHDEFQEDSTYGEGKSEPTYVYAPQVQVEMTTEPTAIYADTVNIERTTEPTPVFGTPTPIFKDYYHYTYWKWVVIEVLNASGNNNNAYWPEGQTDATHRVENGDQYYKVTIKYNNGHVETYEGSDPALLEKYLLEDNVVGQFNTFNIFVRDNK